MYIAKTINKCTFASKLINKIVKIPVSSIHDLLMYGYI